MLNENAAEESSISFSVLHCSYMDFKLWKHTNFTIIFLLVSSVFSATHREDHAVWSALELVNSKSLSLSSVTTLYVWILT